MLVGTISNDVGRGGHRLVNSSAYSSNHSGDDDSIKMVFNGQLVTIVAQRWY